MCFQVTFCLVTSPTSPTVNISFSCRSRAWSIPDLRPPLFFPYILEDPLCLLYIRFKNWTKHGLINYIFKIYSEFILCFLSQSQYNLKISIWYHVHTMSDSRTPFEFTFVSSMFVNYLITYHLVFLHYHILPTIASGYILQCSFDHYQFYTTFLCFCDNGLGY